MAYFDAIHELKMVFISPERSGIRLCRVEQENHKFDASLRSIIYIYDILYIYKITLPQNKTEMVFTFLNT